MSGGSMDYVYLRVMEAGDMIRPTTPARIAFKEHIRLVAEALRSIEWVDSGDYSAGREDNDIRKCMPLFEPHVERA